MRWRRKGGAESFFSITSIRSSTTAPATTVVFGDFQFLNLGDLTVNVQHELACPQNLLGVVDLFQVPHHGNGVAAQLTWALAPTAAVSNNGPHKGGSAEGYEAVSSIPASAVSGKFTVPWTQTTNTTRPQGGRQASPRKTT